MTTKAPNPEQLRERLLEIGALLIELGIPLPDRHREECDDHAVFLRHLAEHGCSGEGEGGIDRAVAEQAHQAIKAAAKLLLTLKGTLEQPYADDPRWSPWTRFVDRTSDSPWPLLCKAETALRAALTQPNYGTGEKPEPCERCGGSGEYELVDGSVIRCWDCGEKPVESEEGQANLKKLLHQIHESLADGEIDPRSNAELVEAWSALSGEAPPSLRVSHDEEER